jgi:hypothetical protein
MRLRNAMLCRWIVGSPLYRPKRPLTGNAAPELLLYFLPGALFQRVCAAAQGQQCDCQRNYKGLHLLILWSTDFIATKLKG